MTSPVLRRLSTATLAIIFVAGMTTTGSAQLTRGVPGVYQPIDQTYPTGKAAQWTAFQGKAGPPFVQPGLVTIEGGGYVTFFNRPPAGPALALSPARAAVMVGHTYRLRISDLPEMPGVELYPSIEILDRLHPPPGYESKFPIPVEITREEIDAAIGGRLVTKVVYVEQPNIAAPVDQQTPMRVTTLRPYANLLAEADLLGRPVMIIRLGGRTPDPNHPDPAFFGYGAPVLLPIQPGIEAGANRPSTRPKTADDRTVSDLTVRQILQTGSGRGHSPTAGAAISVGSTKRLD